MRKIRIYLDTSVISHLFADDTPEKCNDTRKLWAQLRLGRYEIIVSPVVFEEIEKCRTQEERDMLTDGLNELAFVLLEETEETDSLVDKYLETGVLKKKSTDDCRHIAVASVFGCKYILSWNMKHFVKVSTIEMVRNINGELGLPIPYIIIPSTLLEGDDSDE